MPHPAAMPHGKLEEAFADVFVVRSSFRAGPGVHFDRNMTVVRQGGELVVINSARLTDAGEAELAKLGKVTHVVRAAAHHGADDPYFVERYGATLWGKAGKSLASNAHPFASATVLHFDKAAEPDEYAVVLPHDGGTLVAGDCYQNWTDLSTCSWIARRVMPVMGFGPASIGKPWLKTMGAGVKADFERLVDMPWKHLVPAHGTVLRDVARDKLRAAMTARLA